MLKLWCVLSLLVSAGLVKSWDQNCIEDVVGFGLETTGGSKGETVQPATKEELVDALCDSVSEDGEQCEDDIPRTIVLDGTFDFSSEDVETVLGCRYEDCASASQFALDVDGLCDGKTPAMFTIDPAGQRPLLVGSHKSIIGLPGSGIIGKGLKLVEVRNVIIQGIVIENINPHAVGAGDAIFMANVENVWIHKNVIKNVGSHMIHAAKWGENRGVTVSSNLFDGRSVNTCDGNHKWMWLVSGREDYFTFVNNRVLNASGRTPLVSGANNFAHVIGNIFEGGSQNTISAEEYAAILAEGNTFVDVKDVVKKTEDDSVGGDVFLPSNEEEANQCLEDLDRPCQVNNLVDSVAGDAQTESFALQRFGNELDQQQKLGVAKAAESSGLCSVVAHELEFDVTF